MIFKLYKKRDLRTSRWIIQQLVFCDNITARAVIQHLTTHKWDMPSKSFWGREFGDWIKAKKTTSCWRFAQFRTRSNKTYWISSHGLGSPNTRLRDCSLGGVRRNPGGEVRESRNFIWTPPSSLSPKPPISVYLPMCFDLNGRFQILAII